MGDCQASTAPHATPCGLSRSRILRARVARGTAHHSRNAAWAVARILDLRLGSLREGLEDLTGRGIDGLDGRMVPKGLRASVMCTAWSAPAGFDPLPASVRSFSRDNPGHSVGA